MNIESMTINELSKALDEAYADQHRAESLLRVDGPRVSARVYKQLWSAVADANQRVYELSTKYKELRNENRK